MIRPRDRANSERKGYQNSNTRSTAVWHALTLLLLGISSSLVTADSSSPPAAAEMAAAADVVALVQARDTDYLYRRNFPYRGSAYLKILIPYKGGPLPEIIEVFEEGLHDFECYFPNPTVFEEGRRYLVFLTRDPEKPERFRGMPNGCAIEILVREDNRYAVRLPIEGVSLSEEFESVSEAMTFADAYAWVDDESIAPARRDELIAEGFLQPDGDRYRWTRGIDLSAFRTLLQPGLN